MTTDYIEIRVGPMMLKTYLREDLIAENPMCECLTSYPGRTILELEAFCLNDCTRLFDIGLCESVSSFQY
jgi:hypothetical protein